MLYRYRNLVDLLNTNLGQLVIAVENSNRKNEKVSDICTH